MALSLFIGMFLGSSATLLIQCWRRRRELRYMSKVGHACGCMVRQCDPPCTGPGGNPKVLLAVEAHVLLALDAAFLQGSTVRQSLVMMHALPAPHTPVHSTQQPALPLSAAAAALPPPAPASSKANSVAGGAPNNKYFSPLNTNKGHGSVVAQLAEMRSSLHMGSDNGGDTHSVAASDQQAPRDKSVAFAAGQVGSRTGTCMIKPAAHGAVLRVLGCAPHKPVSCSSRNQVAGLRPLQRCLVILTL